jgi:uncharacterized protein (UPF0333 family)
MLKLIKEIVQSNKAQAFMEFALTVPIILFLIIVGIILAMTINAKVTISNASHEAGRVAAVTEDKEKIIEVAKSGVLGGGLITNYNGMTTFDPKKDVTIVRNDGKVTVSIDYKQPTVVPMIGALLGNPDFWGTYIPIHASATFLDETKLVGSE